eukprot:3691144-Rhodomonas_salina.1
MSSTYNSVKEKSEKVFLADLHDITNEFSRRSVAAPWPLNVIFIIIDTVHFFVNKYVSNAGWLVWALGWGRLGSLCRVHAVSLARALGHRCGDALLCDPAGKRWTRFGRHSPTETSTTSFYGGTCISKSSPTERSNSIPQ